MKHNRQLPKEVIECWPEIFEGVDLNVIPLHYVKSAVILFKDKTSLRISMSKYNDAEQFNYEIQTLAVVYQKNINDIYFELNIKKIKKDIIKQTSNFLKGFNK